eukprot:CAMPEP_0197837914 /NCGR_PEP_ID=MMETSP1437-20131217/33721_1 /TAXON_ID=49252 ORGANISM="Eucampia antarctica, Strain CCMP1452" /NCGR_SAMPLE_ID=MMETSP1437 /ASSEMBLY_ACC=CAM_ASM_001096 /LENGTH=287 /DNA_ID=CAMNT_0043445345 /DNA_START=158 /DNA_END=1021 /DNA_ORIENTATION=+
MSSLRNTQKKSYPIGMASSSSSSSPKEDNVKMEKRQKRVTLGYRLTAVSYIASLLVSATLRSELLLLAGMSYILSGAAQNSRLTSDTYKRMNLALGLYSVTSLFVLNKNLTVPIQKKMAILSSILACIHSIKGYGYGILGWDKKKNLLKTLPQELKQGVSNTVKQLLVIPPSSLKSFGYQLMTFFAIAIAACQFNKANYAISANNVLLSTITLTLKDAADRNRLEGTTFIQLNILCSIVFAAMSTKYFAVMSSISSYDKHTLLFFSAASSSVFSLINLLTSIAKKKE